MFNVTVKDDACPLNSYNMKSYQVLVKDKSLINNNLTVADSGCGLYYFNANVNGMNLSYLWKGEGDLLASNLSVYHKYNKPGIYPFTLNITSVNGCTDDTYYDTIVTGTFLGVELPGDTFICFGDHLTITPTIYFSQGYIAYGWSTGDSAKSTIFKPPYFDQHMSLSVMDASGCINSDDINLTVKTLLLDIGEDIILCVDDTITFDTAILIADYKIDYDDTIVSLEWFLLGDTLTISEDDTFITTKFGTYVCLLSTTFGCVKSDTVRIGEFQPPIFIDSIPVICQDQDPFNLNDYVHPKGGTWKSPSGGLDSLDKFTPSLAGLGEHNIYYHYIDPKTGCSNSDSSTISIMSLPDTTLTKIGDTLFAVIDMQKYEWFKDGNPDGADTHAFVVKETGKYSVRITDSNGCVNTSIEHYVYIEIIAIEDYWQENIIEIYPNPNTGKFKISISKSFDIDIQCKLSNVLGVGLEAITLSNDLKEFEVDLRDYPKGIYFIEITNGIDLKYFKKIISN